MSDTQQAVPADAVPRRFLVCLWVGRVGLTAFLVGGLLLNWLAPGVVATFIAGVTGIVYGATWLVWLNTWTDFLLWLNTRHLPDSDKERAIEQIESGNWRKITRLVVLLIAIVWFLLGIASAIASWQQM